jgi:hypothetical protein
MATTPVWLYVCIATLVGLCAIASSAAVPPQNIVERTMSEPRLVRAEPQNETDLQRIQRWTQQLDDSSKVAEIMSGIQALHWGDGLTDTQETNAAVIALADKTLPRMTGPIAAYFMTQIDRSAISISTKLAIGRRLIIRFDRSFTPMLYECMVHLDQGTRDDFFEILDKTASWREFKLALCEALLVAGDIRTQTVLLAQRERMLADMPSPTDYASLDQWKGMNQTLSVMMQYATVLQAPTSLLESLQDDSRLGKYPGTPDSIWAMRRLLLMGMPAAELRADILGRVNQLWTNGAALTSGTDFQERQRGGRMRMTAAAWKAAGVRVGLLTPEDAPMVPAPLHNPGCR